VKISKKKNENSTHSELPKKFIMLKKGFGTLGVNWKNCGVDIRVAIRERSGCLSHRFVCLGNCTCRLSTLYLV